MRVVNALVLIGLGSFLADSVLAQTKQFGDWAVDTLNKNAGVFAATVNDSGSLFGEVCTFSDGQCKWALVLDIGCTGDSIYPVLANTATHADQLHVVCGGPSTNDGTFLYFFNNWKDLEAVIKDASRVGFAFPMKSEQFKVIRFSLSGRTDATLLAEQVTLARKSGTGKVDTTNTTL